MLISDTVRDDMPVFAQRNSAFEGNGDTYCGPASAGNALLWLAGHGYPAIKPEGASDQEAYVDVVQHVSRLMGTYSGGTQTENFMNGINLYLMNKGIPAKERRFTYFGKYDSRTRLTVAAPDLGALNNLADPRCLVWLNIGWYSFSAKDKAYVRETGHWVALAGIELNSDGNLAPRKLRVSDSRFPAGLSQVTLSALDPTTYIWCHKAKAKSQGFYEMPEFSKTGYGDWRDQKCLLESIVVLRMGKG